MDDRVPRSFALTIPMEATGSSVRAIDTVAEAMAPNAV